WRQSVWLVCTEVSARLKLRFLFSLVFIFSFLSLSKSGLLDGVCVLSGFSNGISGGVMVAVVCDE
ncbi:unnamed protein product, partial [Brassica oleracea var. botrytis]